MLKFPIIAIFMAMIMSAPVAAKTVDGVGEPFSRACMMPVAGFQTGLARLPTTMSAADLQRIVTEYGNLVRATAQSQACFQSALNLTRASRQASRSRSVSPRVAQLQRGVKEVGRIFNLGRRQFKAAFNNGTAVILAGMDTAAGPDTKAGSGNIVAMPWIKSGVALLANSEKISLQQSGLKYLARQSH